VSAPVGPPVENDPTRVSMAIRVPVFTLATVTLGVSAHLAAGGSPPGPGVLGILLAAVALASLGLSHREQRLPRVIAGVAAVQLGVHVALLGHDPATMAGSSHAPGQMVAAHAVAALVLAWWLRRGEAAAWRATTRTIRLALADPRPPLIPPAGEVCPATLLPRPVPALPGPVRYVRGPPA